MAKRDVKNTKMAEFLRTIIGVMLLALVYAIVGMFIKSVSDAPCSVANDQVRKEDVVYCKEIPWFLKAALIATHLLAFALMPFAMYVYWLSAPELKKMQAPFSAILGFAFLMVAITGEIGWHVGQQWFYQEEYNILNFIFYFFFMVGLAFWALGIGYEDPGPYSEVSDILLKIGPLLVTLFYAVAATIHTRCSHQESTAICLIPASKIPIYILMAFEFGVLSWRLWKLLDDWRVVFVPIFSVGVNLAFIFLLNNNIDNVVKNPLYHILHDLIGTELGVFIGALLIWYKAQEGQRGESEAFI